jgi:hypothetical protein
VSARVVTRPSLGIANLETAWVCGKKISVSRRGGDTGQRGTKFAAARGGIEVEAMEQRYDAQFKVIFEVIQKLMAPPPEDSSRRGLGFTVDKD